MSLVVVAIPREDDYVWKISSEKIPHMTLLFLGDDVSEEDANKVVQFVEHAASLALTPFWMLVDRRGDLGEDQADVLFFVKERIEKQVEKFRTSLLMHPTIKRLYESTEQFPTWTPHITLGYPGSPAKTDVREYPSFYSITFDRIAVWTGDFEGPEFILKDDRSMDVEVGMSDQLKDFIAHYGVKGQRWGVRRSKAALARQAKREGRSQSEEHARAQQLLKKKRSELTNDELKFLNDRLNLETNFARLNPGAVDRGRSQTNKILATVGVGATAYNLVKSPAGQAAVAAGKAALKRATSIGGLPINVR